MSRPEAAAWCAAEPVARVARARVCAVVASTATDEIERVGVTWLRASVRSAAEAVVTVQALLGPARALAGSAAPRAKLAVGGSTRCSGLLTLGGVARALLAQGSLFEALFELGPILFELLLERVTVLLDALTHRARAGVHTGGTLRGERAALLDVIAVSLTEPAQLFCRATHRDGWIS